MSTQLQHANDSDLHDLIAQADEPVLVDFWAEWCGPCRALAPTLDELSTEFAGRARIAKVNVDDNPGSAREFGIQSIPTLIVFSNGEEKERIVGAHPKASIASALSRWTA